MDLPFEVHRRKLSHGDIVRLYSNIFAYTMLYDAEARVGLIKAMTVSHGESV